MDAFRNRVALSAAFLIASASGCHRQPSAAPESRSEQESSSFRDISPRDFLLSVFARYRSAGSYHDRGVVRLSYETSGREESRVAPMSIWLDQNQLYVDAYDVHLLSNADSLTAWITDSASSDFGSQVLRVTTPGGRPTIDGLFSDRVLADRIAAGLAGPPPQLEWLLAREPMKLLFHEAHVFDYGSSESIDQNFCRSVRVGAGNDVYEFWVDETEGIIRRVDLPPVAASLMEGQPLQTMSLRLELNDASFEVPRHDPDIKPLPPNPRYVQQFVPPHADAETQKHSATPGPASFRADSGP